VVNLERSTIGEATPYAFAAQKVYDFITQPAVIAGLVRWRLSPSCHG
jgi:hypothetical protein